MSITRRLFLRRTAAAGAVGATVAVSGPAQAEGEPLDLIEYHLRELTKAMQILHPDIDRYMFDASVGMAVVSKGLRRGTLIDGIFHDVDRGRP